MARLTSKPQAVLLAAALVAMGALTLALASKTSFYADTWEFLMDRRSLSVDALLRPHNEHLVVIPVLIEQLLLRVFGMTSTTPEYVVLIAFLMATAALLYVYLERRVGSWLALFATLLVLFLGPAWEVLMWPFEVTFVGPILFGLAMLLALERDDRRGDVVACACLTLALGFSSLGLPFIVAAAVAVIQGDRKSWLRRAFVVVIPVVLFAVWYAGWGHEASVHLSLHNVLASPRFVFDAVAVAVGSLIGLGTNPAEGNLEPLWGQAVLVALIVIIGLLYRRRPRVSPGLWPVAAAALSYWFLTAFNAIAGREPTASRYQYASAIFILLILANLLPDIRLRGYRAVLVAAVLTAIAVGPNLVVLKQGTNYLEQQAVLARSDTAALEIARHTVKSTFQLNPEIAGTPSLVNVFAGPYFEAVSEYGSPAYSESELESAREEGRRQADIVLGQALPLTQATRTGEYRRSGSSRACMNAAGGEVQIGPGKTRIEVAPGPPAAFSLRRFASGEYPVATEGAPGESTTTLTVPRDASTMPWHLHVEASQPVRVCP